MEEYITGFCPWCGQESKCVWVVTSKIKDPTTSYAVRYVHTKFTCKRCGSESITECRQVVWI